MHSEKNTPEYLDGSINSRYEEKSSQLVQAILERDGPLNVLEIGPGGGASLAGLAERFEHSQHDDLRGVQVTCLELFPSRSESLFLTAQTLRLAGATVNYVMGDATALPLHDKSMDIVNCSSVIHEVYSYREGMEGINNALSEIERVTKPGGSFLYRDVYPVDLSLHTPVKQVYKRGSWKLFTEEFIPFFLKNAQHSYDENSILKKIRDNMSDPIEYEMPAGLAREIQRHYITFRNHVMKAGLLGITIDKTRFNDTDWVRTDKGFEKKIYIESIGNPKALEVYEDRVGVYATASKFDDYIDDALKDFFKNIHYGYQHCKEVLDDWLEREGKEAYIYESASKIIDMIRINEESKTERFKIEHATDISQPTRDYYTEYLKRVLKEGAFKDKKLIATFKKV